MINGYGHAVSGGGMQEVQIMGCIGEPNSQDHAHTRRDARSYTLAAKPSSLLIWLEEVRFLALSWWRIVR